MVTALDCLWPFASMVDAKTAHSGIRVKV